MLLNNPIFQREFKTTARSSRTLLFIISYLLILAGILLLLWPSSGIQSVAAEGSKQIFSIFFSVNLTLVILLVPAFSATSITYEKENNTFAALFSTLLSPLDIATGKLLSSILILILLPILSLPIASACALTGGVSFSLIIKIVSVIILTAISYGLLGLACSALSNRSSSSVLLNYIFIMLIAGGSWLPSALLGNLLPSLRWLWQILRSASPYDILFNLLMPGKYHLSMGVEQTVSPFIIFILFSILLISICFTIFYLKIISPFSRKSKKQGDVYDGTKKSLKRKLSWPFYLFDPLKRKKLIGRFSNPVFVAEMRSKLFSNPQFLMRTVSAIFIISLVLLVLIAFQAGSSIKAETIRSVAIIFQIGVVAILAPAVSSGLITDEITAGTFTALRMTPISPITVVVGKLKATFFYAMIFIVSSIFIILAMAYLEQQTLWPDVSIFTGDFWTQLMPKIKTESWWQEFWKTYWRLFIWVAILLLSTISFLTSGLFASTLVKKTGVATAIGYGITAFICLISFAPVILQEQLGTTLSRLILSVNPIAGAMQISNDAFQDYPNLWIHNIYTLIALNIIFLVGATVRTWLLFREQK